MKRLCSIFIVLLCAFGPARAQFIVPPSAMLSLSSTDAVRLPQSSGAPLHSWDGDIRTFRNNFCPSYDCKVDDYLQYTSGLLLLSLKACGYQSRSSWGRMLVSDAFSAALVVGSVNGLKYAVKRQRPNGGNTKSFPSGHSATAFMLATMLHHEYGWRSPWFSFGGYALAALTTVSRIARGKHWMSDTIAGAVLGAGLTELGYFLADLIFKDKGLTEGYQEPPFSYCSTDKGYWSLQLGHRHRFIVGASEDMPYRGSEVCLSAEFPLLAGSGICVEGTGGSLIFKDDNSFNSYSARVGMFWEREFAKVLEFEAQALIGYASHKNGSGIDLSAAASLNLVTGNNFKLRALAEWETFSWASRKDSIGKPFLNSVLLGFGAAYYW